MMSTRPASILLDPRLAARRDEPAATDLQQVAARVFSVLRRRRWLFVFPLLTGMAIALAVSLTLPRRYQLGAIFERRDDVVITKLVTENSPYSFSTLRQALTINLIGYNAVSEAVDQLGLTTDLPRDEEGALTPEGRSRKQALVLKLSRQLEIGLLEKSNLLDLIEVRYKGDDPELGVRLVTQLKDNYIVRTRAWISDILHKAQDFFQQEVSRRAGQAARMEAELLELTLKHPGVDPSDPDVLHDRILKESTALDDLQRRREEVVSNIVAREEYFQDITRGVAATRPGALLPALPPHPQRQKIQQEIDAVRTQIADARALRKMTDQHPHVAGLLEKLARLEAQLNAQPETLMSDADNHRPTSDPLEAERRRLNMELKTLRETLAQLDREIPRRQAEKDRLDSEKGQLFERRQHFMMRQQELQATKSDLAAWNRHLETISRVLAAEAEERGIRFATVEDARCPRKPSSPTLAGVFALSGGAGLALAVAVVFLREVFDRSFRSAARVRLALGIPVFEALGELRANAERGRMVRRTLPLVLAVSEGLLVLSLSALAYLSVEQPDRFQGIVERLFNAAGGG